MVSAIDHFCDRHNISGCNFLYVDPEWRERMESHGFSSWLHHSYIWQNQGYQNFDNYLGAFNANQRRNIKRERKAVDQAGLLVKTLTGEEIPQAMFAQMYAFYENTCDKFGWWGSKYLTKRFFEQLHHNYRDRVLFVAAYDKEDRSEERFSRNAETDTLSLHDALPIYKFGWWGSKYLTKRFFEQLHHNYRDRVLFVAAYDKEDDRHPIGMSFCLYKGDRLYGRYWGSLEEIDCLHFDACYYTPIEWAIDRGIQSFDPGAGGRHKKRRGFPATPNYSLHRFYNNRLAQILKSYIGQINEREQEEIDAINEDLPFTKLPPLLLGD